MTICGLKQLITGLTHILETCINLTFTNQSNIVMNPGIHLTLHSKYHHQVIYSKLNLKLNILHTLVKFATNRAESFDKPKLIFWLKYT